MKKVLLTRIVVLLLIFHIPFLENQNIAVGLVPQASFTNREYLILTEEEYLKLPNDKIDIAVGSLIIAKGNYPDIDIKKYLNQIDTMAKELEPKLKICKNPYDLVKTINRYLFVKQKLKFNENKVFINNVLDEKYGQCTSFSCLYLSITERLQLPFYGIAAPEHMYVRYDDGTVKINIETTAGGDIRTEEKILESLGASYLVGTARDSRFLKNLTKRQLLSSCLNNRGSIHNEKGDIDKAKTDYNKAIDLDPKFAAAYYGCGLVYYHEGDLDKAIENFNKAIDLDPKYSDAFNNRGIAYKEKGNIDKAIMDFTKAIDLDPKGANNYKNRGIAYKVKGDIDKAIVDYTKAIDLDPKDADAYYLRGTTYKGKGDIGKAIVDFTMAIDLNPKDAMAYYSRGGAFINMRDFDKALLDFSSAIALNSENASFYYLRAIVYFVKGDKKNALQDSKKAIELDSGYKSEIKDLFETSKEYAEDEEFKKIIK
jgi:tetratricopeptide (TPR) repeat protein